MIIRFEVAVLMMQHSWGNLRMKEILLGGTGLMEVFVDKGCSSQKHATCGACLHGAALVENYYG